MNFEIFDDDFEENKKNYKKEIDELSKKLVRKGMEKIFSSFVNSNLTCTRNYYIILFALKTMQNVLQGDSYDIAPFKAFSFLPDVTFFQTMCMVCKKFLNGGEEFAKHFNVEIEKPNKKFKNVKNLSKKNINS